mgnify:FL=1
MLLLYDIFLSANIFTKPTSNDINSIFIIVFMKKQVFGNGYYIFFFIALLFKKLTFIV